MCEGANELCTVPERVPKLKSAVEDLEALLFAGDSTICYGQGQEAVPQGWDLWAVLTQRLCWNSHGAMLGPKLEATGGMMSGDGVNRVIQVIQFSEEFS